MSFPFCCKPISSWESPASSHLGLGSFSLHICFLFSFPVGRGEQNSHRRRRVLNPPFPVLFLFLVSLPNKASGIQKPYWQMAGCTSGWVRQDSCLLWDFLAHSCWTVKESYLGHGLELCQHVCPRSGSVRLTQVDQYLVTVVP